MIKTSNILDQSTYYFSLPKHKFPPIRFLTPFLPLDTFSSPDPKGYEEGMGLYQYTSGNPVIRFDPSGCNDESGHFYTTYIITICAGCSDDVAFSYAYYSQLPDEVAEYDAYRVRRDQKIDAWSGLKWLRTRESIGVGSSISRRHYWKREQLRDKWVDDIQVYLHSLHGGDVEKRRRVLYQLIKAGPAYFSIAERGLLIHAYADSYAHTHYEGGEEKSYPPPWGHMADGHKPDIIANDYNKY